MTARRTTPLPAGWARTHARILDRDRHRCQHPGCPRKATHVDHVVGAHAGGGDGDDNLQALCAWHHNRKTAREANAARVRRTRPAEPHPGLR